VLADCHLHFEGSVPEEQVAALARRAGHRFADLRELRRGREAVRDPAGFLDLYREVCGLFRGPEDYLEAARALARALRADGVAYAEVYVSPEIFARGGLPPEECLAAVAQAFAEEAPDRARCRVLLDAVRHWGPESAERVLDLHARTRLPAVVGFGLGGDEASFPASAFAGVYGRARALGLRTSVHAGEWAGPESVAEALDALRPDRLDHGIAAAADPRLTRRLAEEGTVLCVAPTGNRITGAAARLPFDPLPVLLDAGVRVALSADDPLLFGTTTRGEYAAAASRGVSPERLRELAANSWRAAFCGPEERRRGLDGLAALAIP
jgi:adenosine deaminase